MIPRVTPITILAGLLALCPAAAADLDADQREWTRTKEAFLSVLKEEARAVVAREAETDARRDPFGAYYELMDFAMSRLRVTRTVFRRIETAASAQLALEQRGLVGEEATRKSRDRISRQLADLGDAWAPQSATVSAEQAIRLIIDLGQIALLPSDSFSQDDIARLTAIVERALRGFLLALTREDPLEKAIRSFEMIPLAAPAGIRQSDRGRPAEARQPSGAPAEAPRATAARD